MREDDGFHGYEFDQYLLIGDLVTWPSPAAFAFLCEYLVREEMKVSPGSAETISGLKIRPEQLIAIPGNHDKLLRPDLEMFDAKFAQRLGLNTPPPQDATLIRRRISGRNFAFLSVDASRYTTDRPLLITPAARRHLASGDVTAPLLERVRQLALEIVADDAIRVLVVHYPVDYYTATNLSAVPMNLVVPHEAEGMAHLLEATRGAIDLAVHGHLHRPGIYRHAGIPVVSVGTTCQSQSEANGFYLIKMFESGQLFAEHHSWRGTGFAVDAGLSQTLN
jgi:predicted phosphodiesterase